MIKTIDDLRKRYAVRADKEVFELFMDKCEEFGVLWGLGSKPRDNNIGEAVVFNGAYMDRLGHESVSFMEQAGYKRLTLSDFKPTRTEYVQVTESIFDLRDEFERRELSFQDSEGDWVSVENECDLVYFFDKEEIYRRVEKVVDWQDEVAEYLKNQKVFESGEVLSKDLAYHINDIQWHNATKREFLEMCRVALRANGEIE